MNTISTTPTGLPIAAPEQASEQEPKSDIELTQSPAEPEDRVESEKGNGPGFAHKTARFFGKIIGGAAGILPGAVSGTIKGALNEQPNAVVSPGLLKGIRGFFATAGLVGGIIAGSMFAGIGGGLAGALIGPIIGSAIGGSIPGLLDGAGASIKGMVLGAGNGMAKGAEMGGEFVDWMLTGFSKPHPEPKPAAG